MEMNLFGEERPNGNLRQQMQQVQAAHGCRNGAELHRKWCEIMFPQLNENQIMLIEGANRQARRFFNPKK